MVYFSKNCSPRHLALALGLGQKMLKVRRFLAQTRMLGRRRIQVRIKMLYIARVFFNAMFGVVTILMATLASAVAVAKTVPPLEPAGQMFFAIAAAAMLSYLPGFLKSTREAIWAPWRTR